MIFYFSATGNSRYAAERAAAAGERVVSLRDAVRGRSFIYDVSREERIGFIFPVYFQGLPSIVRFFLKKLELTGYREQYIYTVMTCGQWTGNAADQLRDLLKEKGLTLFTEFAVPMVDNYVPAVHVPDEEQIARILDHADDVIDEICRAIRAKGIGDYNRLHGPAPALQNVMYSAYAHGRSTKPFVVTDHCIGCGLCQEICPCGAILISGGKPAWVKPKCVRCLACLHRCPAQAIHWKKADEDNGRYYNPRVEP